MYVDLKVMFSYCHATEILVAAPDVDGRYALGNTCSSASSSYRRLCPKDQCTVLQLRKNSGAFLYL